MRPTADYPTISLFCFRSFYPAGVVNCFLPAYGELSVNIVCALPLFVLLQTSS